MSATALLAVATTLAGAIGAASFLLQARHMVVRGRAEDVSLGFFVSIAGGYLVWLLYGITIGDVPLIVVDSVGMASVSVTLLVALRLQAHPRVIRPVSARARYDAALAERGGSPEAQGAIAKPAVLTADWLAAGSVAVTDAR